MMVVVSVILAFLFLGVCIYFIITPYDKAALFKVLAAGILIIGLISGMISGLVFKTIDVETSANKSYSYLLDKNDFETKETTNYALMYGIWVSSFLSSAIFIAISAILENQERKIKLIENNHTEHMNYIKLLNKKEFEKNEEEHKKKEEQLFFDK